MKRFFYAIMVIGLFFIFAGCDDSSTKSDDDQTDADMVVDDTETTDDAKDDSETPDEGTGETCKIDDGIVEAVEGYSDYFSFNGVGAINASDITGRPEATLLSKMDLHLEEYSERVLSQQLDFFIDDPDNQNGPSVALNIYGDPVGQTYSTIVVTSLPHNWIDVLKAEETTSAPFSTMVQVYSLRPVTDEISEFCILSVSTFAEVDGTELPEGKLEVCYDKNESFAAGEILRFGLNARMTTDKDAIVDMFSDVEKPEDLCYCVDENGTVECPEETEDDEVTDEVTDEVADEVTDEVADEVTDEVADEVTDEVADEVTDEVTDEVADEMTDDVVVAVDSDAV
jgi:hypothetical protein